ncbi:MULTISPECIES: KTSC domain-containing protein [Streptomyces]|uniref:KTSC domain-containing protein n=1 Tax=Streptomyces TaxID=1883 RepID=UPI001F39A08E|nr:MULTISPECIES: KTSC domain-containing protein [Streptomyces]
MSSSNVRAVGYEDRVLEVEFHSGGVYRYSGVSADLHIRLMHAPSKGRFLHQFVIDRYPTHRVH